MNSSLNQETINQLMMRRGAPALSLYQPTHRSFPERQQDPIRFRHLVERLASSLQQQHPGQDHELLLKPFHDLQHDHEFWNHNQDGLAIFAGEGYFEVMRLQRTVVEQAIVNDRPHVKPLLRVVQSADRYQILCLTRDSIRMFEGNRYALDEISVPDDIRTLQDALGTETTAKGQHGFPQGFGRASERGDPMQQSAGGSGKQEEIDKDQERYFRLVDKAILEHRSRPSGLPLILAALPEQQSHFRRISHNDRLLSTGIEIAPGSIELNDLKAKSWEVMLPKYLGRLDGLLDRYGESHGQGLATDQLEEIGSSTIGNRIATLLVEADRDIPAHIDEEDGSLIPAKQEGPNLPDLLEELSIRVIEHGGEVIVVPPERMPSSTGAAAIYRF
jgi:hypothetical protein